MKDAFIILLTIAIIVTGIFLPYSGGSAKFKQKPITASGHAIPGLNGSHYSF
jgi:hypothetical protein